MKTRKWRYPAVEPARAGSVSRGAMGAFSDSDLVVPIDGGPDARSGADRNVTFVFADLEGSTRILQRLAERYQTLLSEYHRLVRESVSRHGGQVVNVEGDGFFCIFDSSLSAIEAAHDIHSGIARGSWPGEERPRCRIGMHTGSAIRSAEGYVGIDVHIAARIGAAAHGGQTLVSAAVVDDVADHLDLVQWSLVDLGAFDLRGIEGAQRLFRIESPALESVAMMPRARPRAIAAMPATPMPLIGRSNDLRMAAELLMRDQGRVVTLTGPGGTGKTRLAVELAKALEIEFADGVMFIDLSAVSDIDRFLPVVGRSLGIRESPDRTIREGMASLHRDSEILMVLDNLEQLLPEVSRHVSEIVEAMPSARFLVTSRSPLRISWEHEYPVPPLAVPPPGADDETIDRSPAVVMFVERGQAARPLFELNEVTRPVIAEVVRRLDGLPLALELAAARLRVFTVEDLLARLTESLAVLDRGPVDLPDRHRTLSAAVQWSHDLLGADEKTVFRRLGVFAGGWTLPAGSAVCCEGDLSENRVLDAMEDLVAKSLVVFTIDEEGVPRYRFLETLREFAKEQLRQSGEEASIRLRQLDWMQQLAERMLVVLPTPGFPAFLDEVERERFNIRDAFAWSVANGVGTEQALNVCGMLPLFWDTRGYVAEGLRWTRALVAMTTSAGTTPARAKAHTAMGWLEMLADEPEESEWALATAVGMFRELDDGDWLGRALSMQGMTTFNQGRLDEAESQFHEAIELNRAFGLDWLADGWCKYGLAHIAMARGDFVTARDLLDGCLEFSRRHGLTWGVGHAQLSIGVLAFMIGDLDESIGRIIESMGVRRTLRDARGLGDCIAMMSLHASVRGDHELAAILIGGAEAAREASGDHLVPWQRPLLEQAVASAEAALGPGYEVRYAEGRDLSVEEAIALILERFAPDVEVLESAV
ncbi:MAG TPA: adenylate/guanylate cyclase domain-containing protein [Acidimicrobiia bacterium]|nr:adenylate/guanylate cyclase domain-containing protein [Acidimicrobiia bacterium]